MIGAATYVDADWDGSGAAMVLEVSEGTGEADRRAGLALLAVAARAAEAVADVPPERVEVIGTGFVAEAVRRLVGECWSPADGGRPAAVIDATGDPKQLLDAARRLDDLGTLVLAGEAGERAVALDLYADVHLRGLRIVGVPGARDGVEAPVLPDVALAYLDACPPTVLTGGDRRPPAAWYRVA